MKGQINCIKKKKIPKLRGATTIEYRKINWRFLAAKAKRETRWVSEPSFSNEKQTHSSGKTNYFLAEDSKRNLLWRTLCKVPEYVYLTQVSSVSHGIYLPFTEVNFRAQQVDSVSSNLQCQCAVKWLLPILCFTGPSINIWSNWAKVSNCP